MNIAVITILLTKQQVETTDVSLNGNHTDGSQAKEPLYFNYEYFAGGEPAKTPNKMDGPQRLKLLCLRARVPDGARAPFTKYSFHLVL